jgi:hypothetical protein
MVFNWLLDGLGFRYPCECGHGFIQAIPEHLGCDDVLGDNIIGNRDPKEGGAAYAPYQIPRYTRRDGAGIHIFYALSTWNPYQTFLMRHVLTDWDRFLLLGGSSVKERIQAIVEWFGSIITRWTGGNGVPTRS